jgi:hypothetical protein
VIHTTRAGGCAAGAGGSAARAQAAIVRSKRALGYRILVYALHARARGSKV